MLERYILALYLKYSFLIVFSLAAFFSVIDMIGTIAKLPDSANLVFLYALFRGAKSLEVVLPISLIFGAIAAKIHLIRANELTAAYSLGASRLSVMKMFVFGSLAVSCAYIALQATDFAYLDDRAYAIYKNRSPASATKDLFFKYDDSFVYVSELFPLSNSARGIDILEVEKGDLTRLIHAESGFFENGAWTLRSVTVTTKPVISGIQQQALERRRYEGMLALKGFRPDVMDRIYETKSSYSLIDSYNAWEILSSQGIGTDRIRAFFYSTIFLPLFAPLFTVIIFVFVPISPRLFNVAVFSSFAMLFTLVGWGVLFTLSRMARSGAVQPELALLAPFAVMFAAALCLAKKIA
ncbi:MAG: LptF/LptG family permease [Helicobacteraceae bacterium]|jgi:lipopolysaccharide export system permease protein|nr:LptF/LptG family permease [Helicobacteraceae bacterium]